MFVSRSLDDCALPLQRRFKDLVALWESRYAFRRLVVTCTYRDVEAQRQLWEIGRVTPGRVVTFCNGVTNPSPHNRYPAEAVDVAVRVLPGDPEENVVKESILWKAPLYWPLRDLAQLSGLVSGGTFKMKDWPHLELPPSLSTSSRIQST